MSEAEAKFSIGQLVHHVKLDYRGVVFDVDATFDGDDEWYEQVARSRPPKDKPWYHVLPDDENHATYVAEQHLAADITGEPIRHPALADFFLALQKGRYPPKNLAS